MKEKKSTYFEFNLTSKSTKFNLETYSFQKDCFFTKNGENMLIKGKLDSFVLKKLMKQTINN